jgi:hypothetical protein
LSSTAVPRKPEFMQQLLAIRDDPKVRRLALARAGDLELARDALDQAYCAVALVPDPEKIRDLRAYYCRTLINAVIELRYQFRASLLEDFERVAETRQDEPGCHPLPPRPLDEKVIVDVLFHSWLEPFAVQRPELAARLPGRSSDPDRYRDVIVSVAERVLLSIVAGDVSDADSIPALRAAYPEWFDEPGCAENACHQRFCRARADVRSLLRTIVSRDDLYH